jgi:hypothetical protein
VCESRVGNAWDVISGSGLGSGSVYAPGREPESPRSTREDGFWSERTELLGEEYGLVWVEREVRTISAGNCLSGGKGENGMSSSASGTEQDEKEAKVEDGDRVGVVGVVLRVFWEESRVSLSRLSGMYTALREPSALEKEGKREERRVGEACGGRGLGCATGVEKEMERRWEREMVEVEGEGDTGGRKGRLWIERVERRGRRGEGRREREGGIAGRTGKGCFWEEIRECRARW